MQSGLTEGDGRKAALAEVPTGLAFSEWRLDDQ